MLHLDPQMSIKIGKNDVHLLGAIRGRESRNTRKVLSAVSGTVCAQQVYSLLFSVLVEVAMGTAISQGLGFLPPSRSFAVSAFTTKNP